VVAALLALLALVLGTIAIVVLMGHPSGVADRAVQEHDEPLTEAAKSAAAPAETTTQCLLARSARRIYGAADRSIPQLLLNTPDERVAVGFAANRYTAVGLSLDPAMLTTRQELLDTGDEPVSAVVPLWDGGLRFVVDRQGEELAQAQTVTRDLVLGITDEGFVRRRDDSIHVVWPGGGGEPTTAPRTATISDGRHAVTFRRGGQSGDVLVGWVKADGTKASRLGVVPDEGLAGTPSVAANPREILVTFASRPDADAKWGVALARAPHGAVPERSLPFIIPPGGPGVETIAPAATGLDDGRWLLQWTEGATGNRQVRVQTLAGDLKPIGDAITLSAVEDNAGQGVVHAVGDQVLSLFLVIRGGKPQLWAAALKCD
jgi:hypothetical protein